MQPAEQNQPSGGDGFDCKYHTVTDFSPGSAHHEAHRAQLGEVHSHHNMSIWAREREGFCNIFCTKMNVLLLSMPLGIVAGVAEWSAIARFGFNFIAIIPLASILGLATESLASHTGQMIGGLLNATCGNMVEMIVVVNALKANLVDVVQGSLLGSILSNLLLVLGMSFFVAGVFR